MVALVGPSGAGKTTAIMKLAVLQGILLNRSVRIFVFDPLRVGSTSQLERFADLLTIPFQEFETLEMLSQALTGVAEGLTFIDTPGFSRLDAACASALARRLRAHPGLETQLVLRADRRTEDNIAAIEMFRVFNPARLIVTALDETTCHRELPALILGARIPVSFLSCGQRVPEDIEEARVARLREFIAKGMPRSARTAA